VSGQRRMGVALARGNSIEEAREKAISISSQVTTQL
jgi:formate-dependent phosphoribosylglycinamide formyltransferase (GAR transformylase)